jgi:hypothetical protein
MVRLTVVTVLLSASANLAAAPVAGAQDSGNGTVSATAVPRGVSSISAPCTADTMKARSEPGYQGTYSAFDRRGAQHSYAGPLSLTIEADVYQNQHGTFDNAQCAGNAGFSQPIKSASLISGSEGPDSLWCSYDPAKSTHSRHDQDLVSVVLAGTCTLIQGGVSYVVATLETHQGRVFERNVVQPQVAGTAVGMGRAIRWSDAYTHSTTCMSATCSAPGPHGRPVPGRGTPGPSAEVAPATSPPGQVPASVGSHQPSAPQGTSLSGDPDPAAPLTDTGQDLHAEEVALDVDDGGAGSSSTGGGRQWPGGLTALALFTLGIGEVASYRKQKRAGRPVFPLLSRLRMLWSR